MPPANEFLSGFAGQHNNSRSTSLRLSHQRVFKPLASALGGDKIEKSGDPRDPGSIPLHRDGMGLWGRIAAPRTPTDPGPLIAGMSLDPVGDRLRLRCDLALRLSVALRFSRFAETQVESLHIGVVS